MTRVPEPILTSPSPETEPRIKAVAPSVRFVRIGVVPSPSMPLLKTSVSVAHESFRISGTSKSGLEDGPTTSGWEAFPPSVTASG